MVKLWYMPSMERYSAIKKRTMDTIQITTRTALQRIMLSLKSQFQKVTYSIIPSTEHF